MNTLLCDGYIGTIVGMKYCIDCGTEKSRKGNYCKPCGYKHRAKTGFKKGHPFYAGGEKGWFKEGHTPWLKGTKGLVKPNSGSFKSGEHRSVVTEFQKGQFANELHPSWKGDDVGYGALHRWVYRHRGRFNMCDFCYETGIPTDFANLDYKYTRDLDTWAELCRKCHNAYDKKNGWGKIRERFGDV
jgi:hypothetical protein